MGGWVIQGGKDWESIEMIEVQLFILQSGITPAKNSAFMSNPSHPLPNPSGLTIHGKKAFMDRRRQIMNRRSQIEEGQLCKEKFRLNHPSTHPPIHPSTYPPLHCRIEQEPRNPPPERRFDAI
jgi:hypothetical protein